MIVIEDGSKEQLPYIKIEIEPVGSKRLFRWLPYEYWFEVFYWNEEEKMWYHDWKKDGGGIGLWRTWRKAQCILSETWYEKYKKQFPERFESEKV